MRLFEDEIELKVIRTHRRALRDIVLADAFGWALTNNVILHWHDRPWTFTANVIRPDWLLQTLEFLARKGVPVAPRAQALLEP